MDLPLHPIVVHLPVVLIPVSSIMLILAVAIRRLREHLAPVSVVLCAIGAIGAALAMLTGEQLTDQVGPRPDHERWALPTVLSAAALTLVSLTWAITWWRQDRVRQKGTVVPRLLGVGTVIMGLTATVFTVLAGHSGAEEVWGYTLS